MHFLRHELDAIADYIAARLDGTLRAIIREELKMTDQAILDLTAADNAILAELSLVVSTVQTDAAALATLLASSGTSLDPAIEAQVAVLTAGTAAAVAAMAALVPQSPGAAGASGASGATAATGATAAAASGAVTA